MRTRLMVLVGACFAALVLGAPVVDAAFPGPNGKIAFVSYRDGNYEIYSMNADGTSQTRLTNDPAIDSQPAWSANGTKVAFASFRDGNYEIYVMNADGSGQTRVTDDPAWDDSPAWSPDGKKIVFASNRDDPDSSGCGTYPRVCNFDIYTMNADGSGVTRLTDDPAPDRFPKWSPDGTKIAFDRSTTTRNPAGTQPIDNQIHTMTANGSNQVKIFSRINQDIQLGDWSPDGSKIVFELSDSIATIDRDGGSEAELAACYSNVACGADVGLLRAPVFSPDGTKVAFSHRDCYLLRGFPCNAPYIQTVNADGDGVTSLQSDSADSPSWQPLVGPQRSDYRNAAQFCKAEREFLGDSAFTQRFGTNGNSSNAYGKCVSAK